VPVIGRLPAAEALVVEQVPVDDIRNDTSGSDRAWKIKLDEGLYGDLILRRDAAETFLPAPDRVPEVDLLFLWAVALDQFRSELGERRRYHHDHVFPLSDRADGAVSNAP